MITGKDKLLDELEQRIEDISRLNTALTLENEVLTNSNELLMDDINLLCAAMEVQA